MSDEPTRILLKLSGEALKGEDSPFSPVSLERICDALLSTSIQWAIVVGAGNLIRGAKSRWLDRVEADTMGMLATVLNALALRAYLIHRGASVAIQSAIDTQLTDSVSPRRADAALSEGAVVIFAGGTGSPLVTTDTAAALRAVSIHADLLVKGSNVAGVYDGDPALDPSPSLIDELTYDEFLEHRYGVMDLAAVEICREHGLPIEVFDLRDPNALSSIAAGDKVGTRIG
jgi:uridylate kinase